MENKNIILIFVIAIVILACVLGAMFLPSQNAKQDSKIAIKCNETLHEGDMLIVKLTDFNNTPIGNESVNVTVADKDGKVVAQESFKTNLKGKASMYLDLDEGNYSVNATFSGNDNFTGNSTSKRITIEKVVVEEQVQQTSSSDQSNDEGDNGIVKSRDFVSWDYAPGVHVVENTYANGDVEHFYDDGSSDYYDVDAHEWRYKNADGSEGTMEV